MVACQQNNLLWEASASANDEVAVDTTKTRTTSFRAKELRIQKERSEHYEGH